MTATDRPDVFFAPPVKPCRHCNRREGTRGRGLCFTCFVDSAVRGQYPSPHAVNGRRGVGNGNVSARPLPAPTAAWPGTPEKLAVMIERAEHGLSLWHPDDAR